MTLDSLQTTTRVSFGEVDEDALILGGTPTDGAALQKVQRVLDLVRRRAGVDHPALVDSQNNFPTGAGLASSASGMAALTVAAAGAAGLELSAEELSRIARVGSGSACRSIFGGFARWDAGSAVDGSDSFAVPICDAAHWDLRVLVAVISDGPKAINSTRGMLHTSETSPYHLPFLTQVPADLEEAQRAILHRDLPTLARVAQRSCLRMHAAMMAADPPLIYLRPASWQVIERIKEMMQQGAPLFFTADAGPNIKIFHQSELRADLEQSFGAMDGVKQLIWARPGPAARLLEH